MIHKLQWRGGAGDSKEFAFCERFTLASPVRFHARASPRIHAVFTMFSRHFHEKGVWGRSQGPQPLRDCFARLHTPSYVGSRRRMSAREPPTMHSRSIRAAAMSAWAPRHLRINFIYHLLEWIHDLMPLISIQDMAQINQ